MLVKLGTQHRAAEDVVDLLLECHGRIRDLVGLAQRLARAESVPVVEVREATTRIRRYFSRGFQHHMEDEEETVIPALRGCDPTVDQVIHHLRAEHEAHTGPVGFLLSVCAALEDAPERFPELRQELGQRCAALADPLLAHLAEEERVLFPALRLLLSLEERRALLEAIRRRRA
jgi:iron-sulfur cluster repair protein YtfE (RIC family)